MIVWKGWGGLVVAIPLGCALLMELFVDANYGAGFYKAASWPLPLALLISSIPVFVIGHVLDKKPARIVIDVETHEKISIRTKHSLFWIRMKYWSFIIIAVAAWVYAANMNFIYN